MNQKDSITMRLFQVFLYLRKEDKGSFLPQNLLVETQVLALPAGAPDEREQGGGGVQQAWSRPQTVPKGRSELWSEREGGQAMGEAVIMVSS